MWRWQGNVDRGNLGPCDPCDSGGVVVNWPGKQEDLRLRALDAGPELRGDRWLGCV